ncbi:MAG: DUF2855 family protein [Pseudomonadota bacterium]
MTTITEIWVDRETIRTTRIVERSADALGPDQIRVAVDRFALTANNVSYAITGASLRYWDFYPAAAPYGIVPVWGMADVVDSNSPAISVGERLWGFFPMASHATLTVGKTRDDSFMDATPHRAALPALYNQYRRTQAEPDFLSTLEDERCLLFPLFGTSYIIYDFLVDNNWFGADQLVIGSVSSKTGFGLAKLAHDDADANVAVVGVTSQKNAAFVDALNCCDAVVAYGNEDRIDAAKPTIYVDMSGNRSLTEKLHRHFGDQLVQSCLVGATHWEGDRRVDKSLPGARPTFFFAPAQVAKRNEEWGAGVFAGKIAMACAQLAQGVKDIIAVERIAGAANVAAIWNDLLDNKVDTRRGLLASVDGP